MTEEKKPKQYLRTAKAPVRAEVNGGQSRRAKMANLSVDCAAPWQIKLIEESGIDFDTSPFTKREFINAVVMWGSRKAMFRIQNSSEGTYDELKSFKPTKETIEAYFVQRAAKKLEQEQKEQEKAQPPVHELPELKQPDPPDNKKVSPPAHVQDRLKSYLDRFENPTPNDYASLTALVRCEMRLEEIAIQESGNVADAKRLTLTREKLQLLEEHRELQKVLGINRATREKNKQDRSAVDYIKDVVNDAAEFMQKEMIVIEHCGIRIGYIFLHFQEMPWQLAFRCPRCKHDVNIPK